MQEAVETGKGKLAESAAFMLKLQGEQSRAKEQIAEYAAQVMHLTLCLPAHYPVDEPMVLNPWCCLCCLDTLSACSKVCDSYGSNTHAVQPVCIG